MNLLYTITSYPPAIGGAQIHTRYLIKELNHNHDIEVVSHWDKYRTDWLMGTTLNPQVPKSYLVDDIPVNIIAPNNAQRAAIKPYVYLYYLFQKQAIRKISNVTSSGS